MISALRSDLLPIAFIHQSSLINQQIMPNIHPTAIVDPGAQIADDATVGPFCIIGPKVVIGSGTVLMSHVHVCGRTTLGEHNTVWPQAVLGGDPQDLKFGGEDSELIIGDHNEIREAVTMHKGTANDNHLTRVGDHNLIMAYCHVAHDCDVGHHIIIANAVQLAGHVKIEDHVIIGGCVAIHHMVTIGAHAFVGGMTRVATDVPPFMIVEGNPAKVRAVNAIGLARRGFTEDAIDHLKDAYKRLFAPRLRGGVVNTVQATRALEDAYPHDQHVDQLLSALRNTATGLHGRFRENARRDDRWQNPTK